MSWEIVNERWFIRLKRRNKQTKPFDFYNSKYILRAADSLSLSLLSHIYINRIDTDTHNHTHGCNYLIYTKDIFVFFCFCYLLDL